MYSIHPACHPPSSDDVVIWRYMNLPKFLDLLETESLYFSQVSKLGDAFEGSLSRPSIERFRERYENSNSATKGPKADIFAQEIYQLNQHFFYVSCWHMSAYESAAMWAQYSTEGIAIRSTFGRLKTVVEPHPDDVFIGTVEYPDYDNVVIDFGVTIEPLFYKRRSFEYEREVRAVMPGVPGTGSTMPELLATFANQPAGLKVKIDVAGLIEGISVSPNRPQWFGGLVQALIRRYGYDLPVIRSSLEDRPNFW